MIPRTFTIFMVW